MRSLTLRSSADDCQFPAYATICEEMNRDRQRYVHRRASLLAVGYGIASSRPSDIVKRHYPDTYSRPFHSTFCPRRTARRKM